MEFPYCGKRVVKGPGTGLRQCGGTGASALCFFPQKKKSVISPGASVQEGHHADLHIHDLGQGFYSKGLTCGEVACEVLSIYFVDLAKEGDIAQEDRRLYHMAEIHTGCGKDGFQVMHDLVCLSDDVISRRLDIARCRIDGYLTGDIEGVTGQDGLAIGTNRGGCVGRVDDLLFHTAAR